MAKENAGETRNSIEYHLCLIQGMIIAERGKLPRQKFISSTGNCTFFLVK